MMSLISWRTLSARFAAASLMRSFRVFCRDWLLTIVIAYLGHARQGKGPTEVEPSALLDL